MNNIMSLVIHYSVALHFDPAISLAVIRQESNFKPYLIGNVGEIGLMQIRPEFVPYTRKELLNPEVNIKVGIGLLKEAKKHCKHKNNLDFLVCYNAGIIGGSKYKYPNKSKYVISINKFYKEYKNVYPNSLYQKRRVACN